MIGSTASGFILKPGADPEAVAKTSAADSAKRRILDLLESPASHPHLRSFRSDFCRHVCPANDRRAGRGRRYFSWPNDTGNGAIAGTGRHALDGRVRGANPAAAALGKRNDRFARQRARDRRGTVLPLVLTGVINRAFFGWTIQLAFPWRSLAWTPVWIIAAAIVAGWIPAWRAGRMNMAEAVRSE